MRLAIAQHAHGLPLCITFDNIDWSHLRADVAILVAEMRRCGERPAPYISNGVARKTKAREL
jgi:hypothetical protein